MGDRYDRLQPPGLISTIASMPRRWRDALWVPPAKDIDDFFTIDDGQGCAAEHVGAAISQLKTLTDAIRTTSYNVAEPLASVVLTAVSNTGSGPWPSTAADGLAEVTEAFESLSTQLNQLNTRDWTKTAAVESTTLSVLQLAQGASRVCAERLAVVERTIRQLAH